MMKKSTEVVELAAPNTEKNRPDENTECHKIMLIFPPISLKERYSKDVGEAGGQLPPLGLLWMAAVLEQDGHTVQILDCPVNNWTQEDVLKKIEKFQPEMIGIATITQLLERAKEISLEIRAKYPDMYIFVGGPHVKIMPEESLKETKANAAIVGEAELVVQKIAKNLDSYREPQIIFGDIVRNLDSFPMPARHLVDMTKYTALPNTYKRYPNVASVITSRGCPYTCTFCSDAYGTFRQRSVDKVIDEIKYLVSEYGTKEISFWDDIFTMNKKWILEFCNRIKEEKIDILWSCYSRLNLVDPEILKAMKEAGCWNIFVGIESGNQDVLDNVKKKMTLEAIREKVKIIKESGIELRGSFVLGLPGETPEKARNTINFAIELDCDYAQFTLCTPYPGTEIWNDYEKWGTLNKTFNNYNEWQPVFLPHGYKNAKELKKMHAQAFRRFYLRPKYIMGRLRKIGSKDEFMRHVKGLRMVLGFV